jgi:hypothetical protein
LFPIFRVNPNKEDLIVSDPITVWTAVPFTFKKYNLTVDEKGNGCLKLFRFYSLDFLFETSKSKLFNVSPSTPIESGICALSFTFNLLERKVHSIHQLC